jgi:hypothetical protein
MTVPSFGCAMMDPCTSVRTHLLQRLLGMDPPKLSSTQSHASLVWVSSLGMWLLMPGPISDSTSELLRQTLSNEG